MSKGKIVVGMSGGVDSSTVAAMLVEQGYDVCGAIMMIYDGSLEIAPGKGHACYGPEEQEDLEDAQKVCDDLGIELHVFDLSKQYNKTILDYVREEYLAGKTPNPCVKCNLEMKFGLLLDQVIKSGIDFDYFATGHYARIEKKDRKYLLKKAVDTRKDQTYFIYSLGQKVLSKCMFPLGELNKSEVRDLSIKYGLSVSDKIESQNFISGGYDCLFKGVEGNGDIVDVDGNVLGTHNGIFNYTIGQRRGLGVASTEPYHVIKIDGPKNQVVVGRRDDLYQSALLAKDIFWAIDESSLQNTNIKAKIRYASPEADCTIDLSGDDVKVAFKEQQMSITPGQAIVFYSNDCVIGGGIIKKVVD